MTQKQFNDCISAIRNYINEFDIKVNIDYDICIRLYTASGVYITMLDSILDICGHSISFIVMNTDISLEPELHNIPYSNIQDITFFEPFFP